MNAVELTRELVRINTINPTDPERPCADRTDASESFVEEVCDAVAAGERPSPGAATYFTDASVLKPALGHPSAVVLGPGEHDQCHKTDEWCRIDRVEQAVEIHTRIALAWCER